MKKIISLVPNYSKEYSIIADQQKKITKLSLRLRKLEDFFNKHNAPQKMSFATSTVVHYLLKSDILYLKAEGSYSTVYTLDGNKILVSQPLKKLVKDINDSSFIRIHQSYLINTMYMTKHIKKNNTVILLKNIELPISRSNRDVLSNITNLN